MKYLRKFDNYNQEINEKWYHNLLAGLMLFSPTLSAYANTNLDIPTKDKIEMSSKEDAVDAIQAMIKYINNNKKEFKDGTAMAGQLNKLLHQYKRGDIDINSMNTIAKDFYQNAKDSEKPVIQTSKIQKSGFKKVGEITTFKQLIDNEKPSTIIVNFLEDTFFESGSYEISEDNDIIKNITDSISSLNKLGYKVDNINIESSTDGQKLSDNLQNKLKKDGYSPSNAGLSEARNDNMKKLVVSKTDISDNQISQEINFRDDGVVNKDSRYNKITIQFNKVEAGDVKPESKTVEVFYKMSDKQQRKSVNGIKYKGNKHIKKGIKDIIKTPKSIKCFSFK